MVRRSLYRRSLKLALDWSVHRHIWRGQALYLRSLFEANSNIRDPRQQRASSVTSLSRETHVLKYNAGYFQRDGRVTRALEAPGSIPRSYCARRFVYQLANFIQDTDTSGQTGSKFERNLPCPNLDRKLNLFMRHKIVLA